MADVICRFCKQTIEKETAYKKNANDKSYYCNYDHWRASQNKIKYKPKKTKANGEPNDRRLLLDYIQELYVNQGWDKHNINWKLITSVLKNQMSENKDMTYGGIQYTLWYCKEILEKDLFSDKSNSVLWCVPYEYQNACEYYNNLVELENNNENFNFNFEPTIIKSRKNKYKNVKKIDLTNII